MGSKLSVGPRWSYDESSRRRKRTAFEATKTIQVETEQLDKIGEFIDAALAAGATGVSDVDFSAKDTAAARRRALGEAVSDARHDAEAIASAGGGKLGRLILLSTEQANSALGVKLEEVVVTASRRNEGSIATDIEPKQIKIRQR